MNEIFIKPNLRTAQRRSKDETIIDRSLFTIPEYKNLDLIKILLKNIWVVKPMSVIHRDDKRDTRNDVLYRS